MAELWKGLSADERVPFQAKSTLDKARYEAEMLTYVPPVIEAPSPPPVVAADVAAAAVSAPAPVVKVTKPKKPKTAEQIFSLESGKKLREDPEFKGDFDVIGKALAEKIAGMWAALSDEDREVYTQKSVDAKAAFDVEMVEYTAMRAARAENKREGHDDGSSSAKKRSRTQYSDVCSLCEEPGLLLECSGTCYCSYHPFCIGISVIPEGDFSCDACTTGHQRCFFCDEQGDDLRKCDQPGCHKS